MSETIEKKLLAIRKEWDDALMKAIAVGKKGKHTITTEIDCGDGGGISTARIGVSFVVGVELR